MKYLSMFFVIGAMASIAGCGKDGATGPAGIAGASGQTGVIGAPGESCSVATLSPGGAAPNGGSLISCPDGSQSVVLNGASGAVGATGAPGSSAESVTAVPVCPNQGSPSYGNFPEVGFCIQDVLYVLFEDGAGNLSNSPLSNGTYSDASNNQTCSFTVSGCSVTQN